MASPGRVCIQCRSVQNAGKEMLHWGLTISAERLLLLRWKGQLSQLITCLLSRSGCGLLLILCKYYHSTKLYRKISRVCCRLYCCECAAWQQWQQTSDIVFGTMVIINSFIIQTFIACSDACMWLVIPDTDSHVTCSRKIQLFINCVQLQGFPIDSIH